MPTNCLKCGTALSSGAAFCANCGWQVTDPGMATVAVATATGTSASLGTVTFTATGT